MTAAEPAGGWTGAALGAAAAQFKAPTPIPPGLLTDLANLKAKLDTAESRLKHREEMLDKANATNDDLAARIVDLEGKLAAITPGSFGQDMQRQETIARLQASDTVQRRTIALSEARVHQLMAVLMFHEIEIPQPPDLPGWNR